MRSRFRKLFQAPIFDDPELTRRAQNLQVILYGLFLATCLWAWYPIFFQGGIQVIVAVIVLAVEIGIFVLVKVGKVALAGSLISTILWIVLIVFIATFGGIRNSGFVTFTVVVVIATLTLGARSGFIFAVITILAGIVMVVVENQGWLPPYAYEPNFTILISNSLNLTGVSLLLFLSMRNISKAMSSALENEKAQKEVNKLLEASRIELESRTEAMEQRNIILETLAEVGKLASHTKNETTLLEKASQLLAEKISLDYVNIFLLDQTEEYAILQASNVAQEKERLIVLKNEFGYPNFAIDAIQYPISRYNYYIQRPSLLPETKTSFTFPLRSSDRIYGIINIQTISPTPSQFDEQTLQTFADQISLAIENIRLFEQLENRVKEVSILAGKTMQEAWNKIRGGETFGYSYDRLQVLPTKEKFPDEVSSELSRGKIVSYVTTDAAPHASLAAPIILRENVIGIIGYEDNDPAHVWQESEKNLLETVASRVSLALENSRLVAEAERRAEQERLLSRAANRMRETLDIDTVLKTAVIEIKRALNAEKTEVRLLDIASEKNPAKE